MTCDRTAANGVTRQLSLLAVIFLVVALCWMTFHELIGIRFTNPDDMWFSMNDFRDYFHLAGNDAVGTGRFGMYYAWLYYPIVSAFWNTPLWDVAMYGGAAAVVIGIVLLARYLGAKHLGLLFALLYLAFIPVTYKFNLLVSYPFRYTSGLLIWLAALCAIEAYLRTGKRANLVTACILSFVASMHHETMFAIIAAVNVIFVAVRRPGGTLKDRIWNEATGALLGTSIVYAIVFAGWYVTHPTGYAGNTIKVDPGYGLHYLQAVAYYISASIPLFHYFQGTTLPFIAGANDAFAAVPVGYGHGLLEDLTADVVARAAFVAFVFLLTVRALPRQLDRATAWGAVGAGLCLLVLPPLVVSLSSSYQVDVRGGYAPLHVTFFGYFGATVLLATAIVVLSARLPASLSPILAWVGAVVIGAGALVSGTFNHQIATAMHVNSDRWTVASMLMRHFGTETASPATPSAIVAPQLWNYAGSVGPLPQDYWHRLFAAKAGLDIQFEKAQLAHVSKTPAVLYYDCQGERGCLALLERPDLHRIDVLTTSAQPRFFDVSDGPRTDVVKVAPLLERPATLLEPALYATSLQVTVGIAHWRLEL